MTYSFHKFSTYNPCPCNKKITIVDGSLATVVGQGDISVPPTLKLKNALHVPKLSTNLISIYQLVRDLHCNVTFFTTYLFISGQAYREGDWTC